MTPFAPRRPVLALSILAALTLGGQAVWAQGPDSQASQWVNNLVQGCWACGAFNLISAIGLSFADQIFAQLAGGLTILIGLFMGLWVLGFAAKLLLPFGADSGREHWNALAQQFFRLMLILAFLQGSGPFWNYIFIPVISSGMAVASGMATATDGFEAQFGSSESPPNGTIDYCSGSPPPVGIKGLSGNSLAASQAMAQMDCPLSRIQSQFAKGIVIGVAVMSQGTCMSLASMIYLPIVQNFIYLAAGLVLIAVFLFGYLIFPFLLVDVVMRVSLVAATAPLLIAACLFKSTSKIAIRALWTLAQCALTLMFGAAVGGLGKAIMAYILSVLPVNAGQSLNSWQTLTNALENPCSTGLSIGFFSSGYYMLIGAGVILIFMMRRAGSLATEITHVASDGVGAQAGLAFLVGTAAGAAGRATQFVFGQIGAKPGGAAADKARKVAGEPSP